MWYMALNLLPCRLLMGSLDGLVSPIWNEYLRCERPPLRSGESLIWCSFLRASTISGEFLLTNSFLRASTISGEFLLTNSFLRASTISGEFLLTNSFLRASLISGELLLTKSGEPLLIACLFPVSNISGEPLCLTLSIEGNNQKQCDQTKICFSRWEKQEWVYKATTSK